ncbi:MAG: DUF2551 domain-containing protein [Methermicoccaceae archaeon]
MGNEQEVLQRLISYVSNDPRGVRRMVLRRFAHGDELTTKQVIAELDTHSIEVSPQSIYSMVGMLASRMRLLKVSVNGKSRSYAVKEEYLELLRSVLEQF